MDWMDRIGRTDRDSVFLRHVDSIDTMAGCVDKFAKYRHVLGNPGIFKVLRNWPILSWLDSGAKGPAFESRRARTVQPGAFAPTFVERGTRTVLDVCTIRLRAATPCVSAFIEIHRGRVAYTRREPGQINEVHYVPEAKQTRAGSETTLPS